MTTFHSARLAERWRTLSLAEQMGNIGSEVYRSFQWHARKDTLAFQRAFDRALELFDLTIADPRWTTGRKELTRGREVFCDYFFGGNAFRTDPQSLQAYFDQFAIAARTGS